MITGQSDGRCVLYYGGIFRTFMNEAGWQHQKGSSGAEDTGQIVAASVYQGVDHACLAVRFNIETKVLH